MKRCLFYRGKIMTMAPDMNLAFAAVARREYIRVGSAPASSAMDGANADQAGALIGPAGEGHCNKHQIHVLKVSGTAMINFITTTMTDENDSR